MLLVLELIGASLRMGSLRWLLSFWPFDKEELDPIDSNARVRHAFDARAGCVVCAALHCSDVQVAA